MKCYTDEDGTAGLETALNLYLRRIGGAESPPPGLSVETKTLSSTRYLSGAEQGERGGIPSSFSNLFLSRGFAKQKGD